MLSWGAIPGITFLVPEEAPICQCKHLLSFQELHHADTLICSGKCNSL